MIVWTIVVGILAVTLLVHAVEKYRMSCKNNRKRRHLIEMGHEAELFYCPGDRSITDDFDDF
ncbi:MAG: hypothetical protein ACI37U_03900 [Bacteroides sp.]